MADPLTSPLTLSEVVIGLRRDGKACLLPIPAGPPDRIDGYTVGAPVMTRPAPHAGEMHPDGDELLFLVSGQVSVVLEEEGAERVLEVRPGQAVVVPRGVWHRVVPNEPSQLFHITPGPGGEHRPPPASGKGR
jgi:mannose-6-phosphate isomerase-like protein (cupin superfamily)